MTTSRPPAVAGFFYPAEREALEREVRAFLAAVEPDPDRDRDHPAKALIVPHAGFRYSGPVAASAYRQLDDRRNTIRRVVLLGPSHRVALRGIATTSADVFETPLGPVRIDRKAVEQALQLPQVREIDAAHAQEHSLEVQLPFLQCVLDDFELVPLSVGDATAGEVAALLEALWGGDETLILISTDLSHYHPYDAARTLDEQTTRAIEGLDAEALGSESACGRVPTRGMLDVARRRGLAARTLDVRNSADTTSGGFDRVVGYGAWALEEREPLPVRRFGTRERSVLLATAHDSLVEGLRSGEGTIVSVAEAPPKLRESHASFVTLHLDGALRGCIGSLQAHRALVVDVAANAFRAGFGDPRFHPLSAEELPRIEIEISVLSPPERMPEGSEEELLAKIRPGIDGLILVAPGARGTLLPTVWESVPDPREFLRLLKRKAGLADDFWSPETALFRYTTESIEAPKA